MTTHIKKDFEIPDELMNIYKEMEVSPVGLLKNYALNLVNGKIHKYEEEFRRKIDGMENEENFEWEDDLSDWEFAVENLEYWKKKAVELQRE
ncbi:MAG: hypothetical protein JETT_3178 [Candidatus Jettenia ecosi]|uniref:Uncharacterized protein n=1 Tax=Candidatus Jettenia ecosi TaxID=2494326 RepID=A0A533QD15_9BACT|nr:MAG: hypothetical protein JETT_3178 [Candidatus Jettenia ecosi]